MLAIDVDSDPISGSVSNGTEVSTPFTGWVELASMIEAARSATPGRAPARPQGRPRCERLGSFPGAKGSEV